jgi:isopropylmalate/homocitrate/citramalate synthase
LRPACSASPRNFEKPVSLNITGSNMPANVILLDQTLREGEQMAGVRFTAGQKIEILHLLEDFGIRMVEVGHPGISAEDEEICRETAQAARHAQILMHARAHVEEVQAAKRAGAGWVGIWASVNGIAYATKFAGRTPSQVESKIRDAIKAAKDLGLRVRFTVEDASRTSRLAMWTAASAALEAGADRISLADTTGVWEPTQVSRAVSHAKAALGCELEVHLHNDFGLAQANALAAADAGVTVIDTSILGIGERSGMVDLFQLAVSLRHLRGDSRFNLRLIPRLARAIRSATGFRPDALRPVIGHNAFTHTSAYHVNAIQKNPEAYESYPPESVGRTRTSEPERPPLKPSVSSSELIAGQPFVKGASELFYHRNGPGVRWVLMDSRVDPRASFYVIQRFIGLHGMPIMPEKHVDSHTHHCDSAFIFWGDQPDGTGLVCSVELDGKKMLVDSPASVFIPADIEHTYEYVSGAGTYINIVLAPEYNRSLVHLPEPSLVASAP